MTVILTWLFCSLLQNDMFWGATNFNQDLSGWDVSSGTSFVSLGLILIICSILLEHVCGFGMTALLTWLFCSLLQYEMFKDATNFDQDLSGWLIALDSDDSNVVSGMYLIFERVLHCIKPQTSH